MDAHTRAIRWTGCVNVVFNFYFIDLPLMKNENELLSYLNKYKRFILSNYFVGLSIVPTFKSIEIMMTHIMHVPEGNIILQYLLPSSPAIIAILVMLAFTIMKDFGAAIVAFFIYMAGFFSSLVIYGICRVLSMAFF